MGGIGGFISNLFGSNNEERATGYQTDPNAYNYGGNPNGANEAAQRYQQQGAAAQQRGAAQADYNLGNQSREGQNALATAMRQRALGNGSIAQMQADRQMRQAAATQASMAASARGQGAMALAQQNAANNVANMQGDISNQAQINAANEKMQAEQAAFGAASGMRGQDVQQAQYNAGLQQQQHGLNDQYSLGMTNAEMGVRQTQLQAQMQQQAQNSANALGAQGINAGVGGQNAAMNQANAQGVVGTAANVAGGLASGPPHRATGGPVNPRAYLVGEVGPELVIPDRAAHMSPLLSALHSKYEHRAEGGPIAPVTWGAPRPPAPPPGPETTSTWGTGPGVSSVEAEVRRQTAETAGDHRVAANQERDAYLRNAPGAGGLAVAGFSPGVRDAGNPSQYQRIDEPLVRADQETAASAGAKEAEGIEMTPEEERAAAGAKHRLGNDKKALTARQKAGNALTSLGQAMSDQAKGIDVGYHGPSAIPQPVPVPVLIRGARAMGGPVSGPGMATFEQMTPGGGMDVLGSLKAHSDFATQYQRQGGSNPLNYGGAFANGGYIQACSARADGGPVEPSKYEGPPLRPMSITDAATAKFRSGETVRDTPAQQSAIARAYKEAAAAQMMRDANARIAAMDASLGRGASVALDGGEVDSGAPAWLDQYMASQQQPTLVAAREDGGPVTPKADLPYVVGQRGPQILTPPSSGVVVPTKELATPQGQAALSDAERAQIAKRGSIGDVVSGVKAVEGAPPEPTEPRTPRVPARWQDTGTEGPSLTVVKPEEVASIDPNARGVPSSPALPAREGNSGELVHVNQRRLRLLNQGMIDPGVESGAAQPAEVVSQISPVLAALLRRVRK